MNFGQWIGFVALVISLAILWQIRQLVLLLFTAVILANALNLLVKQFQRWGDKLASSFRWGGRIKRGYAVFLTIFVFFIFCGAFSGSLYPPLSVSLKS